MGKTPTTATLTNLASARTGENSTLGLDYVTTSIRGVANDSTPSAGMIDEEDETALILADNLKRLELEPREYRFFGKSSGAMLVHTALELKGEYIGDTEHVNFEEMAKKRALLKNLRSEFWTARPVSINFKL